MDEWLKTYNAHALRDCLRQEFVSLIKEGKLSPTGLTDDAVSWCVQWAYNHMDNYSRDPVQDVAAIASRAYLDEQKVVPISGETQLRKKPTLGRKPLERERFLVDLAAAILAAEVDENLTYETLSPFFALTNEGLKYRRKVCGFGSLNEAVAEAQLMLQEVDITHH